MLDFSESSSPFVEALLARPLAERESALGGPGLLASLLSRVWRRRPVLPGGLQGAELEALLRRVAQGVTSPAEAARLIIAGAKTP